MSASTPTPSAEPVPGGLAPPPPDSVVTTPAGEIVRTVPLVQSDTKTTPDDGSTATPHGPFSSADVPTPSAAPGRRTPPPASVDTSGPSAATMAAHGGGKKEGVEENEAPAVVLLPDGVSDEDGLRDGVPDGVKERDEDKELVGVRDGEPETVDVRDGVPDRDGV